MMRLKKFWNPLALAIALTSVQGAESTNPWPENIVADGIPSIPTTLKSEVARYMDFRTASFQSWHPKSREMLITTRFADTAQLHSVRGPGSARKQLTFLPEPVGGGSWQPKDGKYILFTQDVGGGEFFQFFRFDPAEGKITLVTDGKSRNTGARWARSGKMIAFSSTKRTGQDTDLYTMNPAKPEGIKMVQEVKGGGWGVADWSYDESKLLVAEYVSINESYLHLLDLKEGKMTPITPRGGTKISYGGGEFVPGDEKIITTSDKDSEFSRLVLLDLKTKEEKLLAPNLKWDVESFSLSPDGKTLAFTSNEDGSSVLQFINIETGKTNEAPKLEKGVLAGLEWNETGDELGFSVSSARSATDAYSYTIGPKKLHRWTESETGGLDSSKFVEPELIRFKSFDGTSISAFYYKPDAKKFTGKRPVLISIHGGPESQIRPIFQARNNYYLNELGVALITPNVRGSAGYGKTFLDMDNGMKREDSVKDIGALLDWVAAQKELDAERVAVIGGSYGGYMVLASMTHFNDRLRAAVDIVGISNFLTFLKNTQSYRRDLRRVEYGDERDAAMAEHLEKISPSTNAKKITKPILIIQGKNDPRVPYTEAEQMLQAIRGNNGTAWYLLANDEGHGFAKKKNQDLQFYTTVMFLRDYLVK